MLEHTRKPLIDTIQLAFDVPIHLVDRVRDLMRQEGVEEDKDYYTVEEVFPYTAEELPRVYLRGIRYREDLTQKQLAELTGISVRHISQMENGKRRVDKELANKLAKVLNCDENALLSV